MSNQRSFFLFVAFVIIVTYLYYESISQKKVEQKTLTLKEEASDELLKKKLKTYSRHLLIVQNTSPSQNDERNTSKQNFTSINTGRKFSRHARALTKKRLKRETGKDLLNWKFNVNVTKLVNGTSKDSVKVSDSNKNIKKANESISLALYVEGGNRKEFSDLNHAWNSVGNFLKNLFGKSESLNTNVAINTEGLANQIDKKLVFGEQEEKQSSENFKSREGKFLGSLFNFGSSNKENPPIKGAGEVSENKTQTEVMHDLIFITTSSSNDPKLEDSAVTPSILTETTSGSQEVDLELPRVLDSTQLVSETFISESNAIDQPTLKTTKLDVIHKCQNCSSELLSIERKSITETSITEILPKEISTDEIDLKSSEVLKSLCMILQSNIRMSPRFLDISEEGSGSIEIENQVESFRANTSHASEITIKSVDSQESQTILRRAWNTIRNFSFRNKRKLLERAQMSEDPAEDNVNKVILNELFIGLESEKSNKTMSNLNGKSVASLPKDFSLQDCRKFFRKEDSESDSSAQKETSLNEEILTERSILHSNILKFTEKSSTSSDSLISNLGKQETTKFQSKTEKNMMEGTTEPTAFRLLTEIVVPTAQSTNISEIVLKPNFFENFTESVSQSLKNVHFSTNTLQNLFITKKIDKPSTTSSTDLIEVENVSNTFPDSEDYSNLNKENFNKEISSTLITLPKSTESSNKTNDEGRFFSDLIEDDILELGSSDERVFNLFSSGERELKIDHEPDSTINMELQERFIPNLFDLGSGSREIPEDSSEENAIDLSTDNQIRLFGEFFNAGSGERSLDEFSRTTNSELSYVIHPSETMSKNEPTTMKNNFDAIYSEIEVKGISENALSLNTEAFINGLSSGELSIQETNEDSRLKMFNAFGSGDGRDSLEFSNTNETSFIEKKICLNCSEYFNIATADCKHCGDAKKTFDPSYILPESEPTVLTELRESYTNQSSETETYIETTHLSNIKSVNETADIEKTFNSKNTLNNSNDSRFADLLADSEIQSLFNNDQIILSPEPETPSSFRERGGRNDDFSPDSSELSDIDNSFSASEFEHSSQSSILTRRDGRAEEFLPSGRPDLSNKDSIDTTFYTPSVSFSQSSSPELFRRRGRAEEFLPLDWPSLNINDTLNSNAVPLTEIPFLPFSTYESVQNENTFTEVSIVDEKSFIDENNESSEHTSRPLSRQPGRGARGHDFFPPDWLDFVTKANHENLGAITETPNSIIKEKPISEASNFDKKETSVSLTTLREVTKNQTPLNVNSTLSELSTKRSFQTTEDEIKYTTEKDLQYSKQHKTTVKVTSVKSIAINVNPKLKPKLKLCRSARECDHSLNERCFSNDGVLACSCAKTFVRNPKNRKCEAPMVLQTSVRLPGELFAKDLKDRNSWLFQQKRKESIETIWFLLQNDPQLFLSVAEIEVDKFEEGSLVVKLNFKVLPKEDETISNLAEKIDNDLKTVFEDEEIIHKVPLNISSASALTNMVNLCTNDDWNYCDENAECILKEENGYRCQCRDGFLDNSKNKMFPGEVCITFCDPNYCGDHGECRLTANGEKHCLCLGWYFGESCEISGIVVLASFTAANVLLILVVLILVLAFKKHSRSNFYDRNVNYQASHEFPAAIALNTVGPSKFANISTPIVQQAPMIHVTSPSFPGSSIEYDSTFDRSRFSENSKNEIDGEKTV